jgi:hypothetical protein
MGIEPRDADAKILPHIFTQSIGRSLLLALIIPCIRQPRKTIDRLICVLVDGMGKLRSCATERLPRDRVRRTCLWPVVSNVEESGRFSSFRSQAEVQG